MDRSPTPFSSEPHASESPDAGRFFFSLDSVVTQKKIEGRVLRLGECGDDKNLQGSMKKRFPMNRTMTDFRKA